MLICHDLLLWVIASIYIICLFAIEFYLECHNPHKVTIKEASLLSIFWVLGALIFNLILWCYCKINYNLVVANKAAIEFFTGYIVEKSLSLDNIFMFVLIFRYFAIPIKYQKLALNYGVISAVVFRLIIIVCGVWLIAKFHWILYILGGLLIFSGGKILLDFKINFDKNLNNNSEQNKLTNNLIIKLCHKYLRTTKEIHQNKLLIIKNNKYYATPLLLAIIAIEISDLIFATDSIPAILAILNDPFIIFTSNIFAILGLRALYYLLAISITKFNFLQLGIAIILIFVGCKMVFSLKLEILTTLSIILTIILSSILLSIVLPKITK